MALPQPRRGEIWMAIWPNDKQKKKRPVLIVSNNFRNTNQNLLDIIVVKITGALRDDGTKKPINPEEDLIVQLKKSSLIRCAAIFTIEKIQLEKHLGQLSIGQMQDVDIKLKNSLVLN